MILAESGNVLQIPLRLLGEILFWVQNMSQLELFDALFLLEISEFIGT